MMRGAAVRFANGACPAPWRDPRSRGALCEASRADVAAAVGLRAALTRCAYSVRRRERRVDPLSPSLSLTNPRREPRVDPREHGCGAGQRGGGAHEPQAAAAREQEEEEEASEDRRLWEVSRSACEPWDGVSAVVGWVNMLRGCTELCHLSCIELGQGRRSWRRSWIYSSTMVHAGPRGLHLLRAHSAWRSALPPNPESLRLLSRHSIAMPVPVPVVGGLGRRRCRWWSVPTPRYSTLATDSGQTLSLVETKSRVISQRTTRTVLLWMWYPTAVAE